MPVVLAENQPMELRWVGVVVYVENIALQNQFVHDVGMAPFEQRSIQGYTRKHRVIAAITHKVVSAAPVASFS
ncbi:MAG: hypothetical protein MUO37_10020 [Methyloceanibacter sp.]|jgi:hypothetical protein|nr:hypothetical protein [Methyloceanibacter sp.]